MRIGLGILLALTLSGPAFASGDASPVAEGDDASAQAIIHTFEEASPAREASPASPSVAREAGAELPVLHPGGDPLFHLDDDAVDVFSLRRSFTPRNVLEACLESRDARCIGVAGPRLGGEIGHGLVQRPACRVRSDGTPSHAEAVARARVFERQAPFLLAIPIDGVKTRPIERASTC
ncbi:MAG: hypothetical protein NXI30_28090 [bacterium]|nr:hypothetical protein [bacterium]